MRKCIGLCLVIGMMVMAACGKKDEKIVVRRATPKKTIALKKSAPATQATEEASATAPSTDASSPATATAQEASSSPAPAVDESGKINLNTADIATLQKLPRIGAKTAQKIIDYRTEHGAFKTTHDIVNVPRIGEKTFQKFADQVTVGGGLSSAVSSSPATSVPATGGTPAPASAGARININTATPAELQKLPKIGKATAQNIVAYRDANGPFKDPHDIVKVKRIGEKTYAGFKDQITVQ